MRFFIGVISALFFLSVTALHAQRLPTSPPTTLAEAKLLEAIAIAANEQNTQKKCLPMPWQPLPPSATPQEAQMQEVFKPPNRAKYWRCYIRHPEFLKSPDNVSEKELLAKRESLINDCLQKNPVTNWGPGGVDRGFDKCLADTGLFKRYDMEAAAEKEARIKYPELAREREVQDRVSNIITACEQQYPSDHQALDKCMAAQGVDSVRLPQ